MSRPLRLKALFFDLDGTLVDTLGDLSAAVNHALGELGLPRRTEGEVRGFIGEGVAHLLKDALGPAHASRVDEALAHFTPYYLEHATVHSRLYPGVAAALERAARTHKLAVVTNKPEAPSRKILDALGIGGSFAALIGGDTLPVKKPDPAPVREAARRLDVAPQDCALVGDSGWDVQAAHRAGAKAVAVTFGYRPKAELAGADAVIDRFEDLLPLVEA